MDKNVSVNYKRQNKWFSLQITLMQVFSWFIFFYLCKRKS